MARVLVIDDCEITCKLLAAALASKGVEVTAHSSPFLGIACARDWKPDIILLDLDMPAMNGVACLKAIRADVALRNTPVIMVSATPAKEMVVRVAQFRVQGIVLKGPRMTEVLRDRLAKMFPDPLLSSQTTRAEDRVAPECSRVTLPRPEAISAASHQGLLLVNHRAASNNNGHCESIIEQVAELPGLDEEWSQLSLDGPLNELRRLKPFVTRSQLEKHITDASELRAMGPVTQRVLSLTGSRNSTNDEIARAIKQDQALSLKILRLANSSLYTSGTRVESVAKAVSRIGVAQIHQAVISMAIMDQFDGAGLAGRIQADQFWEHSVATGLIASRVAKLRRGSAEEADAFFTSGLLHDVGRMLFAIYLGDTYGTVIETADRLGLPLELVESRLLLTNHAELTDRLLRRWKLSLEMINPIVAHHQSVDAIRSGPAKASLGAATMAFANRLAHALLLGCSGNDAVYTLHDFLAPLGITARDVEVLATEIPDQTLDLKCAMLMHAASAVPARSYLDIARAQLGDDAVRPLRLGRFVGADAVGLLLHRLSRESGSTPNVAVLTPTSAGEGRTLVAELAARERAGGWGTLPVMVVASNRSCLIDHTLLAGRKASHVALPARLPTLLRAFSYLLTPATRGAMMAA